jgi:hypothetical protein
MSVHAEGLMRKYRREMEDKKKESATITLTIEFTPNQSFSWRSPEEAAHFWKGYISQVTGHKVVDNKVSYKN